MRIAILSVCLALAMTSTAAVAQPAPPASPPNTSTPAAGPYSTSTTDIGTLLDDPAARAVLLKDVPDVVNNPQSDMARGMTLKDVQQYAPDMLSDQTLAKIDADLAKLPSRK